MNKVILVGRLTRQPELKTLPSGSTVCNFSLAVDRAKKDAGADFISCVAFGKSAEILCQYKKKGDAIAIDGHITTGSYQNREGQTVYTTEVTVDRVEFLPGQKSENRPEEHRENIHYEDIPDSFQAAEDDIPF